AGTIFYRTVHDSARYRGCFPHVSLGSGAAPLRQQEGKHMSFSYQVNLSDPTNAGGSADPGLVYDLQQALNVWSQFISGLGTLGVELDIANTTEGREAGGPTSSFFVGTNQGLNVFEPSSLYELTTGNHVAGTTSDITITIDPGYFKYLDLAQNLAY